VGNGIQRACRVPSAVGSSLRARRACNQWVQVFPDVAFPTVTDRAISWLFRHYFGIRVKLFFNCLVLALAKTSHRA